jgi:hypothetical protein
MRFCTSYFFTYGLLPSLFVGIKILFKFGFKFDDIFAFFDQLSAIIYSREPILPLLFNTESFNSPHHKSRASNFLKNYLHKLTCCLYRESILPVLLIWRVITPRIVYSWESLLTAESYFQKIWRTPPSFKGTMKQEINYPCTISSPRIF